MVSSESPFQATDIERAKI